MKAALSIARLAALAALSLASFFLVLSEDAPGTPLSVFAAAKACGLAMGYAAYRLGRRWKSSDPLVARCARWCASPEGRR